MPRSDTRQREPVTSLSSWIVAQVNSWGRIRDQEHREMWAEAWRLWRMIWDAKEQEFASERSRAIMPVLMNAIDNATEEIEEAIYARERWIDVYNEPEVSSLLIDECDTWKDPLIDSVTYGALYGTGIGLVTEAVGDRRGRRVAYVPIDPHEFATDPLTAHLDDGTGSAWTPQVSIADVMALQDAGVYDDVLVTPSGAYLHRMQGEAQPYESPFVDLIEWHGLVPEPYLDGKRVEEMQIQDAPMVEAIVTIANETDILRAIENPYGGDRGFVSYQDGRVPGRFWGRSVHERARWPQKSLDTEMRARQDALSFHSRPMTATRAGAIARGTRFEVRAGGNIFLTRTAGPDSFRPIQFPPPDPGTYQQSRELERHAASATGTTASPDPFGGQLARTPAKAFALGSMPSMRRSSQRLGRVVRGLVQPAIQKAIRRLQHQGVIDADIPADLARVKAGQGTLQAMIEQEEILAYAEKVPDGPTRLEFIAQALELSNIGSKRDGLVRRLQAVAASELAPKGPSPAEQMAMKQLEIESQRVAEVGQVERGRLQLESQKLTIEHQREMLKIAIMREGAESKADLDTAKSLKEVATARKIATEVGGIGAIEAAKKAAENES